LGLLYAMQAANFLLPLVSVPYLARVLGPEGWGRVVWGQSLGLLAALVVEYGFNLSAARQVAQEMGDRAELARTVSGTYGAQLLLLAGCGTAGLAAAVWLPVTAMLAGGAFFWMIPQAMSGQWFFQGTDRMEVLSGATFLARALGLAGLLGWVTAPEHAERVLWVQAGPGLAVAAAAGWYAWRETAAARPRWSDVRAALERGRAMFLYRGLASAGSTLQTFLFGLAAPAPALGLYGGAERLVKAALAFLDPLQLSLYPKLARSAGFEDEQRGWRRRAGWLLGAAGAAGGLTLAAGAPLLTSLLLGPGFATAAGLVAVMAVNVPLAAWAQACGVHRLLVAGREREFNAVVLGANAGSLLLAAGWLLGGVGAYPERTMALLAVTGPALQAGGFWWMARRRS
jgi:PST family polysaccharide transporter